MQLPSTDRVLYGIRESIGDAGLCSDEAGQAFAITLYEWPGQISMKHDGERKVWNWRPFMAWPRYLFLTLKPQSDFSCFHAGCCFQFQFRSLGFPYLEDLPFSSLTHFIFLKGILYCLTQELSHLLPSLNTSRLPCSLKSHSVYNLVNSCGVEYLLKC